MASEPKKKLWHPWEEKEPKEETAPPTNHHLPTVKVIDPRAMFLSYPSPRFPTLPNYFPPTNPIVSAILGDNEQSLEHNRCAHCGMGFRMTSDLVQHMRMQHQRKKREEKKRRNIAEEEDAPKPKSSR